MRHHELMSVNGGGWHCVVCGAVFPFETCLEEIMGSACNPLYTIDLTSFSSTAGYIVSSFDVIAPADGDSIHAALKGETHETFPDSSFRTRRPDTTIRKGERLLDAWMKGRSE